jgi:chemotaxis protein methyltransferase CheR
MLDLTHVQFQGVPTKRGAMSGRLRPAVVAPAQVVPRPAAADPAVIGLPAAVLERAGLSPAAYRQAPLARRVGACLRAVRASSESAAVARLADPALLARALSTMLIGVSGFFRDQPVFDALRQVVIPALGARPGPLRACSIGCSTGEELYSLAILLAEAGLLDRAHLTGIDCRRDAVDLAREGLFDASIADVEEDIRSRYFVRERAGWRPLESLRSRMTWRVADATRDLPAGGPWDLVLCRNLVIYLQDDVSDRLFQQMGAALAPGGFLVVGKAERPPASLGFKALARCVYRRHGD